MVKNCNCVNCGRKLSKFEKGTSLYKDSDEVLCFMCKGMIEEKLSKYNADIKIQNLDRSILDSILPSLRMGALTDSGEHYLIKYVDYVEEQRKPIKHEQNTVINNKHEDAISSNPYGVNSELIKSKKVFMSTTGYNFDGYAITKYVGIKSGEVVLGTGIFSEFSAGISDLFGTKSLTMANKLTEAKNAALSKLIDNCILVNANAVIGVDIDIMTIGTNMIVACANGTAVIIKQIRSEE